MLWGPRYLTVRVYLCGGSAELVERTPWVRTGNGTSEKYQILGLLRVVLRAVDPVHRDLGSRDDLQLRQLLLELRDLAILLLRIFVSEGIIRARRPWPWPHVDHCVFQPPEVLLFVLVFGVLNAEESLEFEVLVARFLRLPLTLLGLETFVLSLSSLFLLCLLPELSQKSNVERQERS